MNILRMSDSKIHHEYYGRILFENYSNELKSFFIQIPVNHTMLEQKFTFNQRLCSKAYKIINNKYITLVE